MPVYSDNAPAGPQYRLPAAAVQRRFQPMIETRTGLRVGRTLRISLLLAAALVLAACERAGGPAPLMQGGAGQQGQQADVPGTVVVRKGESLYRIARRFGVPLRDLIEANNIPAPFMIKSGRRLNLPSARDHVVKKGESLYGISRRYGIAMNKLVRHNDIQPPYSLSTGRRLRIPGRSLSRRVARAVSPPGHLLRKAPTPAASATNKSQRAKAKARSKTAAPRRSAGRFAWPLRGRIIARFGPRGGGLHNDGINIAAKPGVQIRAAEAGTVAYAGNELQGFGNLLLIRHSGGWMTAYGHAAKILVKRGDRVRRGQTIARVGSSGNVSIPQLHFEIRHGDAAVNPSRYLAHAGNGITDRRIRSATSQADRPGPG